MDTTLFFLSSCQMRHCIIFFSFEASGDIFRIKYPHHMISHGPQLLDDDVCDLIYSLNPQ